MYVIYRKQKKKNDFNTEYYRSRMIIFFKWTLAILSTLITFSTHINMRVLDIVTYWTQLAKMFQIMKYFFFFLQAK